MFIHCDISKKIAFSLCKFVVQLISDLTRLTKWFSYSKEYTKLSVELINMHNVKPIVSIIALVL